MPARPRRVLDPIHGLIEFGSEHFESTCWRLLETPQFQRLRRVKQLGFSDFVYPGATHSRFTHSVGVFHTARKLAEVIDRCHGDRHNKHRAQAAMAAALVHDLGHGPFSHAFEDVLRTLGLGKHEARSVKLIEETEVAGILDDFVPKFSREVAEIIKIKNRKTSTLQLSLANSTQIGWTICVATDL
jgi:HD superfamily phosphohydrolase